MQTALERAYQQNLLWPPVHAAVDVYSKRKAAGAEAYELTWRLIHVWECTAMVVAQAATARILQAGRAADARPIREKAYGRTWNEGEGVLNRSAGALSGVMDKWIEILEYIASLDPGDSLFLQKTVDFLNSRDFDGKSTKIQLFAFLSAWSRACDTPAMNSTELTIKAAFKVVNSFRNRFAHVPFPYDPLEEILSNLERCTAALFESGNAAGRHDGALAGGIAVANSTLKGATTVANPFSEEKNEYPQYVHAITKSTVGEHWLASPFVHVDRMLRPYVLSRLKDQAGHWEYTRYLAESNAVISVIRPQFLKQFPIPDENEYKEEFPPVAPSAASLGCPESPRMETMGDANLAIRRRDYEPAITFLRQMASSRPNYHVAWLRLGHALREYAVALQGASPEGRQRATALLQESRDALLRAGGHSDLQYRAEAHYQLSKTCYRCWLLDDCADDGLEGAIREAEGAASVYPDIKFDSWLEYLRARRNEPLPIGCKGAGADGDNQRTE